MKKIFSCVILILIAIVTLTACSPINYGEAFSTKDELLSFLKKENITLMMPSYMPSNLDNTKYNYVATRDMNKKTYVGYKMYCFSEPYNSAVYGYNYISDKVVSDDANRLEHKETKIVADRAVNIYIGKNADNKTYFIIAMFADGNNHYEIRIVGSNDKGNIDLEGESYNSAMLEIDKIINGIK